jgi:E3 ubiquitin-protein ligase MARCH6
MMFVLDTAIGLLVWLPFTLGKSTALLSVSSSQAAVHLLLTNRNM